MAEVGEADGPDHCSIDPKCWASVTMHTQLYRLQNLTQRTCSSDTGNGLASTCILQQQRRLSTELVADVSTVEGENHLTMVLGL